MTGYFYEVYLKGPNGETGYDISVGYVSDCPTDDPSGLLMAKQTVARHFGDKLDCFIQCYSVVIPDNPVIPVRSPGAYRKIDVTASIERISTGGGDGAYDLIGRGQTVDEFLSKLRETLLHPKGINWLLYGPDPEGDVRITISIGNEGTFDNL